MAEIDFDDDDLDLEEEHSGEDAPAAPAKPAGFFSKKRLFIIVGILAVVFGIGAVFFMLSTREKSPSQPAQNTVVMPKAAASATAIAEQQKQAEKEKKEEEKKNRKIKYDLIFQSLTPEQKSEVLYELSLNDIQFKTMANGKNFDVYVDRDAMDRAKKLLAVRGLPASSARGYQLLDDQQTLGVTEFDKRIRFMRALIGELEIAIMQLDAVEMAKVQIVMPEQRLFAVTQPPVTASILIRGVPGAQLTDSLVFSIIQLVSNSVENLQPENVSVVDTEGHVLSEGLFERLAQGTQPDAPIPTKATEQVNDATSTVAEPVEKIGQPIIPDFKELKNWLDLKSKYEQELTKRAMRQVLGLLPAGSYKIMVNAEIGAVDKGKVLDIRRLSASIVIDNSNDAVYVDDQLRQQIYQTIAGAIGYVKGRDRIDLSYADFHLLSEKDKKDILRYLPKNRTWLKTALKILPYLAGVAVIIGIGLFGYRRFRKPSSSLFSTSGSRENKLDRVQADLTQEKHIDNIRQVVRQNPKAMANIVQDWLKGEV